MQMTDSRVRILAHENFEDFPELIEWTPEYNALGEYHFVAPMHYDGNWYEATNGTGWGRSAWLIVEEDGRRCAEQAIVAKRGMPILATGDMGWENYTVRVLVRPLSSRGKVGLLFRYQHNRAYYGVFLENGNQISLESTYHDQSTVLARAEASYGVDEYYSLAISVVDQRIKVFWNDSELISVTDGTYSNGKIALAARVPARFSQVGVTTSLDDAVEFERHCKQRKQNLLNIRKKYPLAKLWRKMDTATFGAGKMYRFGDLDGDGQLEILMVQNQSRIDNGNFRQISCLTATDLDGNVLWQVGEPTSANWRVTCDLPVQIHDIDGDGHAEVIMLKDFRIQVLDGKTGQLKMSAPSPKATHDGRYWYGDFPEDPFDRVTGDAIAFADFNGGRGAQHIIIKDRYSGFWVYNNKLELQWNYDCETGHYPAIYDINGDGRDEIMMGNTLFDYQGNVLWSVDLEDHVDGIAIGPFGPNGEVRVALAAGHHGFILLNQGGEVLRTHKFGHVQKVTAARLVDSLPGYQFVTINYWENPGMVSLFDCDGNPLTVYEAPCLERTQGSAIPSVNWLGNGTELILMSGNVKVGGLFDAYGNQVVTLPNDGHPDFCSEAIDLDGDGIDEIVVWDPRSLWIYKREGNGHKVKGPRRYPALFNSSNYAARVSIQPR